MSKDYRLPLDELRISITSSCNMACVYCHNEGNHTTSELSLETIENLVSKAMLLNLKSVRVTGGEPLVHKDIMNICRMLKNKYHLQVGLNTNGIRLDIINRLIDEHLIDRVSVGIDYFDQNISKNSPIGYSSQTILNNILEINKRGINVTIDTVYDGNYQNLYNLTKWALDHNIRIKILEEVNDIVADNTSATYCEIRNKIIHDFGLVPMIDNIFNEVTGYYKGQRLVSFFHSHCRIRECDVCANMHLRVTSNQKFKPCLLNRQTEMSFNNENVLEQMCNAIDHLGESPKVLHLVKKN